MIRLDDTNSGAVASAIAAERHRQGSPATGMVLTLLILADEECQSDATAAAVSAAREHPMRVVTLIPRPGRVKPTLDAEIAVGGDDGPGEITVLRLRGELSNHANSVAIPLLLSDTPVVAYWPSTAPQVPAEDPIGKHAQRRITDSAMCDDPMAALHYRATGYRPGDSDLTWTRTTPWRSALAAAFDRPTQGVERIRIIAETANPSAALLKTWLQVRLQCPVEWEKSADQGISSVSILSNEGELTIQRLHGSHAILRRPFSPDAPITLPDRELSLLLSEELRRLDPDDIYGEIIQAFGSTERSL